MLKQIVQTFVPRQRAATVQTLGHPAAGIIGWWNPDSNASGEAVTPDTALSYAAFWCGVRVISEIMGSLPCILYERIGETDKRRASNDPRYYLVHDAPNEELDAYHFFEVSTSHQVVWGNSYAKIIRSGMNEPLALELRLPDRTEPSMDAAGSLIYKCSEPREMIESPDMLHGYGFGFDGVKGYSVIDKLAQAIGICLAGDRYAGSSMKNGGVAGGILEHPQKLQKPAREELRREWEEIHGGASKAGRIAIMHGGMKFQPISMSNEAAQLIEQRKFGVVEIARVLRLPLYILADLENSGVRANIEQQAIDLIAYSMMPWVKRWEGALKMKLLRREERGRLFFEFLLDSLLRSDTKTRYEAHALARQWGWLSVNDIRRMENLNAVDDGDIYLQPMNMAPAGWEPPDKDDTGDNPSVPETIRKEYKHALQTALEQTVDTAKEMRSALQAGFVGVEQAFSQFGQQLESTLATERETYGLIKQDISTLGKRVQVRSAVDTEAILATAKNLLAESLRVLLKIEAAEAAKAARSQANRGENFVAKVEDFYSRHRDRAQTAFVPFCAAKPALAAVLADEHVSSSKRQLLECADGPADGFESRVAACVEQWGRNRAEAQAGEYHGRIYGTGSGSE